MGLTRAGIAQLLAGTSIEMDAIESVVAGKADAGDLTSLADRVTTAEETLGTRAEEAATQTALAILSDRLTTAENSLVTKADVAATTASLATKADRVIASVVYTAAATTLQADDADRSVGIDSALSNTLTIPPGVFPVGQVIAGTQLGVGRTLFAEGAGVTIRSRLGRYTGGQFAVWTLYQRTANVWELSGDLVAS